MNIPTMRICSHATVHALTSLFITRFMTNSFFHSKASWISNFLSNQKPAKTLSLKSSQSSLDNQHNPPSSTCPIPLTQMGQIIKLINHNPHTNQIPITLSQTLTLTPKKLTETKPNRIYSNLHHGHWTATILYMHWTLSLKKTLIK